MDPSDKSHEIRMEGPLPHFTLRQDGTVEQHFDASLEPWVLGPEAQRSIEDAIERAEGVTLPDGRAIPARFRMDADGTVTARLDYDAATDEYLAVLFQPGPLSLAETLSPMEAIKDWLRSISRTLVVHDEATAVTIREEHFAGLDVIVNPLVEPGSVYLIDTGRLERLLTQSLLRDPHIIVQGPDPIGDPS